MLAHAPSLAQVAPASAPPTAEPGYSTPTPAYTQPASGASPAAGPTQPPIIVEPPQLAVAPGRSATLQVKAVLGQIAVSVANTAIADASVDQLSRTITVSAKALGTTTLTVTDERGLRREVTVLVQELAGDIAPFAGVRITGNPASAEFVASEATGAARRAVHLRAGATTIASPPVAAGSSLQPGDITNVNVPLTVQGAGLLTAAGSTRVTVENFGQPRIKPSYLMVSDYPERLTDNGFLFDATLDGFEAARFLYYHYNPAGQPNRQIVLYANNPSKQATSVQLISGRAGPEANEMEVGHLSTQRFLARSAQDEGRVIDVPAGATTALVVHALPPGSVVSNLMELRELSGIPLHLTLVSQDAAAPVDQPNKQFALLQSDVPHARGLYKPPEFSFDYEYDAPGADLEIPIGQIPAGNLRKGQPPLSGDYGVLQAISVRIVNTDRRTPAYIALYANPRGGRATGTFIIDGVLVQAHAMPPFGHYKLREYTIPPGGYVRTTVTTMPEGGSSYPVRLVVAPDDGGKSPGAPNSYVY